MEVPAFFKRLCREKQICNMRKESLDKHFPPKCRGIPLDQYLCLCVGYRCQKKCIEVFRFKKCVKKPLVGSHVLEYNGQEITVTSLTYFKKEILKFEDHVSFDRATFLLLQKEEKVIRLIQLRDRLQLPTHQGGVTPLSDTTPVEEKEVEPQNLQDISIMHLLDVYNHMKEIEVENPRACMISFMADVWEGVFQEVCGGDPVIESQPNYWSLILD